jgi:translation initiation factor 2 beta subunit (eIF-2beta)/eIF-5
MNTDMNTDNETKPIMPNSNAFATYSDDFEPYDLDYLLDRADTLFSSKKNKAILPTLAYQRLNRKTYIHNIGAIAEKLNRSPENLRAFFSANLRAEASIKEDGSLKIDKVFYPSNLNPVYKNYIKSIQCAACKSINTTESKDDRITYLECVDCHRKVSK